jgi:HK97 family phage major capsid protein
MKLLLKELADLAGLLAVPREQIDLAGCSAVLDRLGGLARELAAPAKDAPPAVIEQLRGAVDGLTERVRKHERNGVAYAAGGAAAAAPEVFRAAAWKEAGLPALSFARTEHAASFADFCRKLYQGETKGLTPYSGSDGGYLIPDPAVASQLLAMVQTVGLAARIGQVIPLGPGGLSLPRVLAGGIAYWKAAGAAGTQSTPQVEKVTLTPETLMALVDLDIELEQDSSSLLGNFLASTFAHALAFREDQAAFTGDGSPTYGGITGVLNSDRVTVVSTGVPAPELMDIDNLADAEAALWDGASENARWIGHRTIRACVKKMKDNFKQPLWQRANEREPANLMDYPFATSPFFPPATGGKQASLKYMCLGDFRSGLLVGRRGQVAIDFSRDAKFASGQVCWRCMERIDIAVNGYTAAEIAANAYDHLANPIVLLQTSAS